MVYANIYELFRISVSILLICHLFHASFINFFTVTDVYWILLNNTDSNKNNKKSQSRPNLGEPRRPPLTTTTELNR